MHRPPTMPVEEFGQRARDRLPGPVLAEAQPVLDALQRVIDRQIAPPALADIVAYVREVLEELHEDIEP